MCMVASFATTCTAKALKDEGFLEKHIHTIFDEALREVRMLAIPPAGKFPCARCADREVLNSSRLAMHEIIFECKPHNSLLDEYRKMFESRISAGATEKLPDPGKGNGSGKSWSTT